jgi:ATP-dependent phosphofructokinase / diphosphate-dependent phosphofructokinase
MPDAFISADGNDVTGAFDAYLRPLLGADVPQAHRLRANPVEKILKKN